jgi:cytochrome c5
LKVLAIFAASLVLGATTQAQTDAQRAAIAERIQAHGEVCLQGDANCGGAVAAASSGPRSGDDVYKAACAACHDAGIAGAPKTGDVAAWADRLAKGNDVLYDSGVNGLAGTGMIAKGGCMDCSDEEIIAAVDFMIAESK